MTTAQYIAIAATVAAYLLWLGWSNYGGQVSAWLTKRETKPDHNAALAHCKGLLAYLKENGDSAGVEQAAVTKIAEGIFRRTLG